MNLELFVRRTEPVQHSDTRWNAWLHANVQYVTIPVALALFLLLWQAVVVLNGYPSYILPTPGKVAATLFENWQNGIIPRHLGITSLEIVLGFSIAFVFSTAVGYALSKSPLFEKVISPYLVASQAVPIVALGPLIVIWIKTGPVQNALIAAMMCFFPILINTIVGIRAVRPEYRELMRSYAATRWQIFTKLEVPAALPVFFGGVRVGVTLAVVGVIVVELLWADRGLGFLLNFARGTLDTPLMFATVGILVAMALSLYMLVVILERAVIRWKRGAP